MKNLEDNDNVPITVITATTSPPIKKAKRNLFDPIFLGGETHVISQHQGLAYLYEKQDTET